MIDLQLHLYKDKLRIKRQDNKKLIYDPIRNKYLVLGPEEVVRQLTIEYLIHEKAYNKNRIGIEKQLVINGLIRRYDILLYREDMSPFMLVECKAPEVGINQETFGQIAQYNMSLQVDYLMVTDGINSFCCEMNYKEQSYQFLDDIPVYSAERKD